MSDLTAGLLAALARIASTRVVCVGDAMLDRFVYGQVGRISPEAPIPVLAAESTRSALGGAGNVAANLRALGADTVLVSVVGDDEEGREVASLLEAAKISRVLITDPSRPTTLKVRYVAAGQQMLRVDRECIDPLDQALAENLLDVFTPTLAQAGVVVVSDYAKGLLDPTLLARLLEICAARAIPVVVDPKGGDYRRYAGAAVVTPNVAELEALTGHRVRSDEDTVNACQSLREEAEVGAVLATRGADGMTWVSDDAVVHLGAEAREVYDVSGAGDTVIATFAAALAGNADALDAARLANTAAGLVVEKAGTATVSSAELATALRRQALAPGAEKLLTVDQAKDLVERWRAAGLRVGFTNGCFDLIHPGHLSLLAQAAKACDRLVVALNDDASVARLKGAKRPIQGEQARAAVLASMQSVDAIVMFGGDTPLPEIEALRPDVLVKGADYTEEQVVGAEIVKHHGGKVLLADLVTGFSTTDTVQRLGQASGSNR